MANPLASLLSLQGPAMHANDPIALAQLRAQQADAMRHNLETQQSMPGTFATGATPGDLRQVEQDMADDPNTGQAAQADVAKQDALRKTLFDYQRPDVSAVRKSQLADQEELATAPARVAGQFAVEAAKDKATAQNEAIQQMLGMGLAPGSHVGVGGVSMTAAPPVTRTSPAQAADVKYLDDLQNGHAHAPGYHYFSGPSQKDLDATEMATVRARLAAGSYGGQAGGGAGGGMMRARDLNGVLHEAPAGTPLPAGWTAE